MLNNHRMEQSLDLLENDEKLLLGFKLILFKIVDNSSKITLEFFSNKYPQVAPLKDYKNELPL